MKIFQAEAFSGIRKESNKNRQVILTEIRKVVKEYAKKNKLDLVVDSSGGGKDGGRLAYVVFSSEKVDITKKIVSFLNRGHEKEVLALTKEREKAKKAQAKQK